MIQVFNHPTKQTVIIKSAFTAEETLSHKELDQVNHFKSYLADPLFPISIDIKLPSCGQIIKISCNLSFKTQDILELLVQQVNVPLDKCRLFYKGKEIHLLSQLSTYSIGDNS